MNATMSMSQSTFAGRLAVRRMELGYSQAELAAKVGCVPVSVSIWENSGKMPNLKYAARLCDALD